MNTTMRVVSGGLGVLMAFGCVVWLAQLMGDPRLTYDLDTYRTVSVECHSIYGGGPDNSVSNYVEQVDGEYVLISDLDATYGNYDDVLTITRPQLTADCATARAERAALNWLPALGIVLGSAIVWGACAPRGPRALSSSPRSTTSSPSGPPPPGPPPSGPPPRS